MKMMKTTMMMKRKQFLRVACVSGMIPLLNLQADSGKPLAAVSVDEPLAKSLHYVENATEAVGDPKYRKGQDCGNFLFFNEKTNNACALFGNRPVKKAGWCNTWKPARK